MTKLSNQAWTLCMSPNSNQSIRPRKWMSKMKVWGYEFIFAMPDENPAQWWMNILEWVDLDPIFFGGWALPLISLSLYFYSFKLWCMGARSLLITILLCLPLKGSKTGKIFKLIKMAVALRVIFPLFYFTVSHSRAHAKRSNTEGSYV